MKEINNIADTTGRATYQSSPTKISPAMEQLYFEMEDKEHVFQIGLKTILECILFGAKEKQLPDLPLSWYTEVCSRYDIPMSELFGEGENTESESLVSISKLSYTCMYVEETWEFTHEQVRSVDDFVDEHGYMNYKEKDGLKKFREQYKDCIK